MNDLKCPLKRILSVRLFQDWVSVKFDFWCPQKTILGVRYLQEYTRVPHSGIFLLIQCCQYVFDLFLHSLDFLRYQVIVLNNFDSNSSGFF